MTTIISAIVTGLILLWGGILGLLKLVDLFERKHILSLGAYATLVAGLVMGLVLVTIQERQKQHRLDMEKQIKAVTQQLNELSNRMLTQLEEKADLTASEFQIRSNLQHEKADHNSTREELAQKVDEYQKLEQVVANERKARHQYQAEQNKKLEERLQKEETRYQKIQDLLGSHQRATQNMQKQLASIQEETSKLNAQTARLQTQQNSLLGKVNTAQQVQDLNAQKVNTLALSLKILREDLAPTRSKVDSLYYWKKK